MRGPGFSLGGAPAPLRLFLITLAVTELLIAIFALLNGELVEFVSAKIQFCLLTLSAAFSVAIAIFLAVRGSGAPGVPTAAHERGCRQCGALDAEEYATEYGWYETFKAGTVTTQAYAPIGILRVLLCERCIAHRQDVVAKSQWRFGFALAAAALPFFLVSLMLLGGPLDREVGFFVWVATLASGTAVAIAIFVFVVLAFVLVVYFIGGARVRKEDQRAFAKGWSWGLAGGEVRTRFLEGEEHTHDYQRWCRVAPKTPEVESWPSAGHNVVPRYRLPVDGKD
mgnify:CR=1 FL=1